MNVVTRPKEQLFFWDLTEFINFNDIRLEELNYYAEPPSTFLIYEMNRRYTL